MNAQDVLARLMQMAGLTAQQAVDWLPLCKDTVRQITASLKPETDAQAHSEELCAVCAALAFYQYSMILDITREENFSAGDVKITHKSGAAAAKQMWCEARAASAYLLTDENFLFERVTA